MLHLKFDTILLAHLHCRYTLKSNWHALRSRAVVAARRGFVLGGVRPVAISKGHPSSRVQNRSYNWKVEDRQVAAREVASSRSLHSPSASVLDRIGSRLAEFENAVYLQYQGELGHAQYTSAHESPNSTNLYDGRRGILE